MRRPLFDVIISTAGDSETGKVFISVALIDTYHVHADRAEQLIAQSQDFASLEDALHWARTSATEFLNNTEAD